MTLMKSLLLGSAAGIVAIASAQAADLPTRKGAPAAEYVRICSITVNGKPVVGWTLPGSDTCFKLSGYITGQVEGGNLYNGQQTTYTPGSAPTQVLVSPGGAVPAGAITTTGIPGTIGGFPSNTSGTGVTTVFPVGTVPPGSTPVVSHAKGVFLVPAAPSGTQVTTPIKGSNATGSTGRTDFGYNTRLNFGFDAVSNTAYGPLVAHAEMQFESGNGYDNDVGNPLGGSAAYLNLAYVTWAGITAGKAPSFFSFTGGGVGWNNFFSPDQQGFNQPDVLAYTASFGGGFSATIAVQSNGSDGSSGGGTDQCNICGNNFNGLPVGVNYTYNGQSQPDIVGNVKVSQGWGSAQASGVAHRVDVTGFSGLQEQKEGFAFDGGVSFNLPQFGAGDLVLLTGAWSRNAMWFSGLPDAMDGEGGMTNGNGQAMALADTYENPSAGGFATPTAWTISGEFVHHFTPEFTFSVEGSYGQTHWAGTDATSVVSNSRSWLAGAVANWDPVKNLDFQFEALYQNTFTDQPNGFLPAGACNSTGCAANVAGANAAWHPRGSGFEGRFEVTRSW
jgi:hypothetical protein